MKEAAIEIVKEFKMNWYELKPMTVLNAYQVECDDNELVYRKSEVDKVLNNKDKEIEDLKNLHYVDMMDLDMENYELKEQLRKQKIQRVRKVVSECRRKYYKSQLNKEALFWEKWCTRWVKILKQIKGE